MSIEEEIRRIVNEELDRRQKHDNLRQLVAEGKISNNEARKRMGYSALPTPKGTDARSILDGEWDFNEMGMPEPVVWQERHDRKTHVSKTPYGDAEVTTVPENRCRWCNELIALVVNPKAPDDFWWHLWSGLQPCGVFNRVATPLGGE